MSFENANGHQENEAGLEKLTSPEGLIGALEKAKYIDDIITIIRAGRFCYSGIDDAEWKRIDLLVQKFADTHNPKDLNNLPSEIAHRLSEITSLSISESEDTSLETVEISHANKLLNRYQNIQDAGEALGWISEAVDILRSELYPAIAASQEAYSYWRQPAEEAELKVLMRSIQNIEKLIRDVASMYNIRLTQSHRILQLTRHALGFTKDSPLAPDRTVERSRDALPVRIELNPSRNSRNMKKILEDIEVRLDTVILNRYLVKDNKIHFFSPDEILPKSRKSGFYPRHILRSNERIRPRGEIREDEHISHTELMTKLIHYLLFAYKRSLKNEWDTAENYQKVFGEKVARGGFIAPYITNEQKCIIYMTESQCEEMMRLFNRYVSEKYESTNDRDINPSEYLVGSPSEHTPKIDNIEIFTDFLRLYYPELLQESYVTTPQDTNLIK